MKAWWKRECVNTTPINTFRAAFLVNSEKQAESEATAADSEGAQPSVCLQPQKIYTCEKVPSRTARMCVSERNSS